VNCVARGGKVVLFVVTVTVAAPAACAGVTAVIVVLSTTVTLVAGSASNVTAVAPPKFVPLIVTAVPPFTSPEAGLIDVTVGGGKTAQEATDGWMSSDH
jgi:hypothetical protein